MGGNHDLVYKYIFAHPEVVRDLLAGFTGLSCFGELDVAAFERVNASYVSEGLTERHGDMVWKVKLKGQVVFIYLLLEFQSHSERWMALRMQVYIGLLYQDLVKRGELPDAACLPPVLPVVLYNGRPPWTATNELRSLVAPGPDELREFQASQRYLLIDQGRIDPALLANATNVAALLFNFELFGLSSVVMNVSRTLLAWIASDERASLRRSINAWMRRVQVRETGGVFVDGIERLLEEQAMGERFQRRYGSWAEMHVDEGRQIGLVQGREEGKTLALRDMLKRQLQHRFGSIPEPLAAVIDQGAPPNLERWIDRVLDASSFDAVFSD